MQFAIKPARKSIVNVMRSLSLKQKKFLDFINNFTLTQNEAPTYDEIMLGLGFKSLGTVNWYVKTLEEGWGRNLDRLNLKRRNAFYGDWWDEASQWRTGGYDRVCAGVQGSPTTAETAEKGVKGSLFVNEVLCVRPGEQLSFLNEVVDKRVPVMEDYNVSPTGLWEVTTNSHEVVMVWATTVEDWTRMRKNLDTTRGLDDSGEEDRRLVENLNLLSSYVVSGDTQLMTPMPGTVYGPSDWEEANEQDWYK